MPRALWEETIESRTFIMETDCKKCKYYDAEDDRCIAFECNDIDCPKLPCEREDD